MNRKRKIFRIFQGVMVAIMTVFVIRLYANLICDKLILFWIPLNEYLKEVGVPTLAITICYMLCVISFICDLDSDRRDDKK